MVVVEASARGVASFLVKNLASGVGSTAYTTDRLDVCLRGFDSAGIKKVPDAAALYTSRQPAEEVDRAAAEGHHVDRCGWVGVWFGGSPSDLALPYD